MNQLKLTLLALATLSVTGCLSPDIPIIGLDADGNPEQGLIPESEYTKRLEAAVTTANDTVIPVLNRHEATDHGWMLREMILGVGINMEIGIGPWKVGALPRFRVLFTNSSQPVTP